jgi:hypothetical protein
MTEITRWRSAGPRKHFHLPLPEPPRTRQVSRTARAPKDGTARALEEWLRELTIARTVDAD